MNSLHRVAAAALALSCLSTAAVASSQERDIVTTRVSRSGIDLRTAAGIRILDARITRAARIACAPMGASAASIADAERCMKEMRLDAAKQIAALNGTDGPQLASR